MVSRPGTVIVEGSVLGSHLGGFGGIGVVMSAQADGGSVQAVKTRGSDAPTRLFSVIFSEFHNSFQPSTLQRIHGLLLPQISSDIPDK